MCPFPVQRPIDIWKNIGATRTIVLAGRAYWTTVPILSSAEEYPVLQRYYLSTYINYTLCEISDTDQRRRRTHHQIRWPGVESHCRQHHQPAQHPQPGRHSTHSRMREEQKTYYPFTCSTSRRVRSKLGQPEEHQELQQQNGHFHVSGRFSI